jgi:hypothetical protein
MFTFSDIYKNLFYSWDHFICNSCKGLSWLPVEIKKSDTYQDVYKVSVFTGAIKLSLRFRIFNLVHIHKKPIFVCASAWNFESTLASNWDIDVKHVPKCFKIFSSLCKSYSDSYRTSNVRTQFHRGGFTEGIQLGRGFTVGWNLNIWKDAFLNSAVETMIYCRNKASPRMVIWIFPMGWDFLLHLIILREAFFPMRSILPIPMGI